MEIIITIITNENSCLKLTIFSVLYLILQQRCTGSTVEAGIQILIRLPASLDHLKFELEIAFILHV